MSKHLTDAECAAEYWRATADYHASRAGDRSQHYFEASTWYMFATLPHAHEADQ